MGWLPTPYTVGHRAYIPNATDPLGNEVEAWAAPVDLPVYGIAPGGSEANPEPEPDRPFVSTTKQLFMPLESAANVGPHDRYIIDGIEWEQNGDLLDYTKGPFGWAPGVVVNIKKAAG